MSTRILRLDRALTHGYLTFENMDNADRRQAPAGHAWMILGGHIQHKTGTNSALFVVKKGETYYKWMNQILAAEANGGYPLFNTEPGVDQNQWAPCFILGDMELVFAGDAAAQIQVTLLEWKLDGK